MMKKTKKIFIELIVSILTVIIAATSLLSSTYAWFTSNNTVKATTTQICATTNGFILQIANAEQGAQNGSDNMSLAATTIGGRITPSSTKNLKEWWICQGWNSQGKVTSYRQTPFDTGTGTKKGQYTVNNETHFAYIQSEYILYTIKGTGFADVYLDASEGEPISVYVDNGETASSDTIPNSMRIAITTQELENDGKTPTGEEMLKVVYAPKQVTGSGNDSEAIEGKWTYIGNVEGKTKPIAVTNEYKYIYKDKYADQFGKNWVATKTNGEYSVPENTEYIAENVGENGIMLRVYIWMEGTDADCVNNAAAQDKATYSVNVKLAGIAS